MKRILIIAIMAIAIGSCDTPQTTTGTGSTTDTTMTSRDSATMTTPDTTRQQ